MPIRISIILNNIFRKLSFKNNTVQQQINTLINNIYDEATKLGSPSAFYALVEKTQPKLKTCFCSIFSESESMLITIKLLNLLVSRYELSNRFIKVSAKPFGLMIDPSNSCTCRCPGCIHSATTKHLFDWPKANMSPLIFDSFIQKFGPHATNIGFFNYGEPFINKSTPQFIKIAKQYRLMTSVSTNLSCHIDANEIVSSGLDHMTLSIDGATKKSYSKYRKGGNFDLIIENIKELVNAKKQLQSQTPSLVWQFLLFEHNKHELDLAKNLAKDLGVNAIQFAIPFSVSWDDPAIQVAKDVKPQMHNFLWKHLTLRQRYSSEDINEEAITRRYKEGFKGLAKYPNHQNIAKNYCPWLYKGIVSDALGRILPCCAAPSSSNKLIFASVNDEDPFNSEMYQAARSFFATVKKQCLDNQCSPHCIKCPDWNNNSVFTQPAHIKTYLQDNQSYNLLNNNNIDRLANF